MINLVESMEDVLKLILSPIQKKRSFSITSVDDLVTSLIPTGFCGCHPLVCLRHRLDYEKPYAEFDMNICKECSKDYYCQMYYVLKSNDDPKMLQYFVNIGGDIPTIYKAFAVDDRFCHEEVTIDKLPVCWYKHGSELWFFGNGDIFKTVAIDTGKMRFTNDKPVDRNELFFGNISTIYFMNKSLYDENVNNLLFTDNWRNKPKVYCLDLFSK